MAELTTSINWLAVLVATLTYFFLGAIWYSLLFTKKWMELRDITEDDIKEDQPNPLLFLWTFLFQLIAIATLALFIEAIGISGLWAGMVAGLGIGVGIVFTLTATTGLFSGTKLGLHFIDNGYHIIGLTIFGAIIGIW